MADRSLSNITLQDAYSRAQAALEGGDSTRAVAITQHILRYYPQYIDAYRLLGEAYLDLGRPEEALRFFTHVLNADPQNVLAHIGRAIIAEDHQQVDIAIDEYERAFEIDPSITEVRGELLRLYAIRYGSAGASIRTTPSGLAYVHLRAGLRDAAISELGYVAQMRPDRWDVEVALAEVLWRNEQLDECAAVAGDILAGHPACVKCKWLLGYLHWSTGRTESGRQYLMDAVALDPAYRIANTIWDATPWPVDRRITRAQTAMVPGWTPEELAGSDLDVPVALPSEPPAPAAPPESRRVTQKFETRPPLPGESQRITQKFETRPPLPGQTTELASPPEAATAQPVPAAATEALEWDSVLGSLDAPASFDLDWLDDWAAAAETTPAPAVETPQAAAPAEPVPAPLEFETLAGTDTGEPASPDMLIVTPAPEGISPETAAEVAAPQAAPAVAASGIEQGDAEIEAFSTVPEEAAPATPPADLMAADATVSASVTPATEPDGFLAWLSEPAPGAPEPLEIAAEVTAEDNAEDYTAVESPAAQASLFPAWLAEPSAAIADVPSAEEVEIAAPAADVSTAQASLFPAWLDEPASVAEEAAPAPNPTAEAITNAVEEAAPAENAAESAVQASAVDGPGTVDHAEDGPAAPARHHAVHIFPAWLEDATSDDEDESDLELLPSWMREAAPLEATAPAVVDAATAPAPADTQPAPPDAAILAEPADTSMPTPSASTEAAQLRAAAQEAPPSIAVEEPAAVVELQAEPPAAFAVESQSAGMDALSGTDTAAALPPDAAASAEQSPLVGESALPLWEAAMTEGEAPVSAVPETVAAGAPPDETAAGAASESPTVILSDDLFPAWLEEIARDETAATTADQPVMTAPPEVPPDEAVPAGALPLEAISVEEVAASAAAPQAMPAEETADIAEPATAPPITAAAAESSSAPAEDEGSAAESGPPPAAQAGEAGLFPAWMNATGAASVTATATPGAPETTSAGPAERDQATAPRPAPLPPAAEAGIFPSWLENMPQPGIDTASPAGTAPAALFAPTEQPDAQADEPGVLPDWLTAAAHVPSPESSGTAPPLALDEETLFAADHTLGGQAGATTIEDDLFPAWLEGGPPVSELPAAGAAQIPSAAPAPAANELPPGAAAQDVAFPAWLDDAVSAHPAGLAEASGPQDAMGTAEAAAPVPAAGAAENIPAAPATPDPGGEPDEFPTWMTGPWFEVAVPPAPGTSAMSAEPLVIVPESAAPPPDTDLSPRPPVALDARRQETAAAGDTAAAEADAPPFVISGMAVPFSASPHEIEAASSAPLAEAAAAESAPVGAPGFIVAGDSAPVESYPADGTPESADPLHEEILNWPASDEGRADAAGVDQRTESGTATAEATAPPARTLNGEPQAPQPGDPVPQVVSAVVNTAPAAPAPANDSDAGALAQPALSGPEPGVGAPSAPDSALPVASVAPALDLSAPESAPEPATPQQGDPAQVAESEHAPSGQPPDHAAVAESLDHFAKVGYNHGDDSQVPHDGTEPGPPPAPVVATGAVTGPVEIPEAIESGHLADGSAEHGASAPAGQVAFATSEEDYMAPSYKEDDDQERQFDFDWDRDALPDYLKPFLMNETPGAAGQPPAPAAPAGPGASAAPPAGRPMPPAPQAGGPGGSDFNLDNIQPFDFGAAAPPPNRPASPPGPAAPIRPLSPAPPPQQAPGGFNESDFGGVQPFDFGAPAGPGGGEFDFGSDALPSWLGSGGDTGPAFSFDTPTSGPQAADQRPGADLSSPGMPDWLRTPETETPQAARPGPPAPPPAAPGGDFDFGGEALPSWLSASAASPAPSAANDFGDVQPFDFGAAGSQGQPQPFDFGAPSGQGQPQPFDFGARAGGGAPQPFNFGAAAPPERGPVPPAGPADEFDFSAVQPFDFGAPAPSSPAPSMPGGPEPGGGDFDFGGIQPFDFGGTATSAPGGANPAAQAAGAPGEFDFSMAESFDFRGPAGSTPAAGGADNSDFGGIQPFDFGGAGPAAPTGPAMAGDFDFGGGQPFDFGGAPTGGESEGDVSDVDDFIDFLSVGAGNAAPAPQAPDEFAFDLGGDMQPFSLEGSGLGSALPLPPPAPAFGAPPAPRSGGPERGSRLPAGPSPEEMGSLAGDEFSFEPFMFDTEGGAAPAFSAPPPNVPASKEAPPAFNQAPAVPTSPFNPGSMFAGRPQSDVPPGLEDLPDLQPFSFEGLDSTSDQGYGFDSGDMGQSFGRRSTDRGETSRSGMAFNLDEESSGPAGDVHSFSWQRRSTPTREPAHAPEAPETAGSIFAKARKRKEELEQTLRQEAEARGEVYTPAPVVESLHPEEAAELRYWPNLDEEEAMASAPAQPAVQPFDFTAVAGPTPTDVAQDMASLQLAPFEFEEEGSPTIQLPEESAQASAQVPSAPDFAAGPTSPAMPEPFAFEAANIPAEIEPFAFDLGVEAAPAAQTTQLPDEPFAFEAQETAVVEPFAFEGQETAPAVEPFAFEAQESGAVEPFAFEMAEPFAFDPSAMGEPAAEVAPFAFEPPAAAAPAGEPFAFDMTEAVEPFTFDMAESVPPPVFETAEPSTTAPQAEAAPVETAAGELLWSIPVAEPTTPAGAERGYGAEVAPGEYDFSGLQPFDLGALDLTPEERAYLTGEQARAESAPPVEPAGIPELQLQHGEPAMAADVGEIEPFSFDVAAFEPPAAEPSAMDLGGVPPAQSPGYEAGAPTATVEPAEFDMGAISEAAPVEPFQFEPEAATPVPVEPFQFEPETAQPFSFETPAEPAPTVTHYETSARSGTGPLAAETWAEIPTEGAFDFSGFEMDQPPAEPGVAEAPAPAVAQAPEAPAAPVAAAPAAEAAAEVAAEPAVPVPTAPAPVAEAPTPVPVAEAPAPVAAQPVPAPDAPPAPAVPLAPAGGSMDELARHLRDNPDDTAGRLALAIGYEQRDDITRATEQYRLLIKGRNVPENLLDIVTGNLRDLVEGQPDNPALHRLLGDAYMKQGQYQMAISQYNWLLTKGTR